MSDALRSPVGTTWQTMDELYDQMAELDELLSECMEVLTLAQPHLSAAPSAEKRVRDLLVRLGLEVA